MVRFSWFFQALCTNLLGDILLPFSSTLLGFLGSLAHRQVLRVSTLFPSNFYIDLLASEDNNRFASLAHLENKTAERFVTTTLGT